MPSVQKLYEELEDAGRDDVAIFALNSGRDDEQRVRDYWEDEGFEFPAIVEPPNERGRSAGRLRVQVFPTNVIVGPSGKVLYAMPGYDERSIREILGLPAGD